MVFNMVFNILLLYIKEFNYIQIDLSYFTTKQHVGEDYLSIFDLTNYS